MRSLHTLGHNTEAAVRRLLDTRIHLSILARHDEHKHLRAGLRLISGSLEDGINGCTNVWDSLDHGRVRVFDATAMSLVCLDERRNEFLGVGL